MFNRDIYIYILYLFVVKLLILIKIYVHENRIYTYDTKTVFFEINHKIIFERLLCIPCVLSICPVLTHYYPLLSFAFYFQLEHLPGNPPHGFCFIAMIISSSRVLRSRFTHCNFVLFVSSKVYVYSYIGIRPLHSSVFSVLKYCHPWLTRNLCILILSILSRLIFSVTVFSFRTVLDESEQRNM